jgi:sugar phosphate isomerase/epimerase
MPPKHRSTVARELTMQLQFSTACLHHLPLRSSFTLARDLSLAGLEVALTPHLLRRGPERVRRLAKQYGVPVRSLDLTPSSRLLNEEGVVAQVAAFAAALDRCPAVTLPAPPADQPNGVSGFLRTLRVCGEAFGDEVALTVVNAAGGGIAPPGPLDNFLQLRRIVEEWEFGYTFDTSHAGSAGWVITEPLPRMGKRLHNVRLGDFRHLPAYGHTLTAPLLPQQVQPWQLHRPPGDGVLPLRAFLRALRRRDYQGLVTIDLRADGLRAWWPPALRAQVSGAVAFCQVALQDQRTPRPERIERPLSKLKNEE